MEIPDASVTPEGQLRLHYNNDIESVSALPENRTFDTAENYVVTAGLWDRLEFGGRLANAFVDSRAEGTRRTDLSASFKLRLFDYKWFTAAAGIADFGGEGVKLQARYGVLSANLPWNLMASVGLGTGPDRLDGPFGGVQWQALPFLSLLVDYDAEEANYGIRAGHTFANGVRLSATAAGTSASDLGPSGSITLSIPLSLMRTAPPPPALQDQSSESNSRSATRVSVVPSKSANDNQAEGRAEPPISNLQVFASTDTPRNSLIAWQKRGLLEPLSSGTTERRALEAVEYRYGVPVRESGAKSARWSSQFRRLRAPFEAPVRGELRISPFLRNIVGTETGTFEYSLAADTSARAQLPLGLGGYVTYTGAIAESDGYRDGGPFARRRIESDLKQAALQWAFHPLPGLMGLISHGESRIEEEPYVFTHADFALLLDGGRHRFRFAIGDYTPLDELNLPDRETRIAEYRFLWTKPQLFVELQRGDYFFGDEGTKVEVSRFFGDVNIGLFYQRDDDDNEQAGIAFSIPLTPGGETRVGPVVLSGDPDWRYTLSSTFNTDSGENLVRPTDLLEPLPSYSLVGDVLDRDRAVPAYIIGN
ncbi:hypothetical protein KHP57_05035 [Algiphilus sp. NNCM1]|nr:hypothetical protein [Algiphilus acroporae]MCI5104214.1 YjbH domain-containing protein [Algiphilus sp.]